jgi:integrase
MHANRGGISTLREHNMSREKGEMARSGEIFTLNRLSVGRPDFIGTEQFSPAQFPNRDISEFAEGPNGLRNDHSRSWMEEYPNLQPSNVIQDSRMTFACFVESKFIPEHVSYKTLAGKTHYQAILKHLLRPETVSQFFDPQQVTKGRLKSAPDWPYLDEVRLCDFSPGHVRRLIASGFAKGYSAQTVKHIRNVISAIISHAQREGCFNGTNPVTLVKLPPQAACKIEHNLTIRQTKEMFELMGYPEKEIALITIVTGMNISEICDLQWKHVNLTEISRFVDGEYIPPMSIAVRTRWNRTGLGDVKRVRARNVEISRSLLSSLKELRRRTTNNSKDDFVLVAENGNRILPASIRMARLKPIGRKLGLPWLSWHVLRRAHSSLLAEFITQLNDRIVSEGGQRGGRDLSDNSDSIRRRANADVKEVQTPLNGVSCGGRRLRKQ